MLIYYFVFRSFSQIINYKKFFIVWRLSFLDNGLFSIEELITGMEDKIAE